MKESLLIIISFVFLVFLTILIYISYKSYENKRQPLVISSVKSALVGTGNPLPSGVNLEKTPTIQELAEEIGEINSLQFCNVNQCVVNLATGIKRCPSQGQSQILYNFEKEICSDIFSCPPELPFAVLSDGQTNRFGQCELGIACRCVADEFCAFNVVDTFMVMGGNPYTNQQNFLNYNFQESNLLNNQGFDNENITIDGNNAGIEFCKLNPSYSQRIQNGCNFTCGDGDPLDCQEGAYVYIEADNSIKVQLFLPDDYNLTKGQNYLHILVVSNFPKKGTLKLNDSNNYITFSNSQKINYKYQETSDPPPSPPGLPPIVTNYSQEVILLSNIITNGTPGLTIDLGSSQEFFLQKIFFEFCSTQVGEENDRNMLNCIQTNNQPCKTGYLTYNVDKGDPRKFTQLQSPEENKNKLLPLRTLENYLLDPSIYTMSCSVGNGCSKDIDLSLCQAISTVQIKKLQFTTTSSPVKLILVYNQDQKYLPSIGDIVTIFEVKDTLSQVGISSDLINQKHTVVNVTTDNSTKEYTVQVNISTTATQTKFITLDYNAYMMQGNQTSLVTRDCTDAIQSKKSSFFNTYDCAAVSNLWLLSNRSNTIGEQFKIIDKKLVIEEQNNLLELENGDYWSIYNQSVNVFTAKAYAKGISLLTFNNIDYITPGMCFSYLGIDTAENNSVLNVEANSNQVHFQTSLNAGVSVGQNFVFYNNLTTDDYGLISNVEIIDSSYYAQTDNLSGTSVTLSQTNNIFVYKQFGFNGINYNTRLDLGTTDFGKRFYTASSYWNSFDNVLTTSSDLTPPLAPINVISDDFKDKNNTFSDSDANFKIPKSMYYPIWNSNNFSQECIQPSPYILAYPIVNSDTTAIEYVQIQYSGQDFNEYVWQPNGDYTYNTFSKIFPNQNYLTYQSTTDTLILDEINPNITVGNNIIDSNGNFETYMVLDPSTQTLTISGTSATLNVTIAEDFYNLGDQFLEDKYNKFIYNGVSFNDSNSQIKTYDSKTFEFTGSKQNYFLGKIYAGSYNGTSFTFSLSSNVNVVAIDNNLIQTDYGGISAISFADNLIQFVNKSEKLEIDNQYSPDNDNAKSTGTDLKIKVSGITDQRITNIDIIAEGNGYINDNRPNIIISNYKVSEATTKNITIN